MTGPVDDCAANATNLHMLLRAAHNILWEVGRVNPDGSRNNDLDDAGCLVEFAVAAAEKLAAEVNALPRGEA